VGLDGAGAHSSRGARAILQPARVAAFSLLQCLLMTRLELCEETVLIEGKMLHERDRKDVFLWIDLAVRKVYFGWERWGRNWLDSSVVR